MIYPDTAPGPSAQSVSLLSRWRWLHKPLAAVLSGVLLACCFWPMNLRSLAWVALVPWLMVLPRLKPGEAFAYGGLLAVMFLRLGLDWLGGIYGPCFAWGVILLMAVGIGMAFRVSAFVLARFGRGALLWVVPLAFTAVEFIRAEGLPQSRFPYLVLGYTQAGHLWIAQIASVGGVYLLSFLLVAANAAIAYGLTAPSWTWRNWLPAAGVGAGVVLLGLAGQPPSYQDLPRVSVAVVQAEGADPESYALLTAEAAAAPSKPAFIVLPEHTLDAGRMDGEKNDGVTLAPSSNRPIAASTSTPSSPLLTALSDIAARSGAYISVGAHVPAQASRRPGPRAAQASMWPFGLGIGQKDCPFDNVNLLVGPTGRVVFQQAKSIPMPFWDDGNPASRQKTCSTPLGRVGLYVCFDESFSDVIRHLADRGAGLLLGNIYNDQKWPVQQRMQQADLAPLRAISQRRCMVRAATSGTSQIIDATGQVQGQRLQSEGPGLLFGQVYFTEERTLFSRGGYLFESAIAIAFLALVAALTVQPWMAWVVSLVRRRRLSTGAKIPSFLQTISQMAGADE